MGYYQGDCPNYAAGDYYQGDYYQGDFLGIGKFVKKAAGVVTGIAKELGVPGAGLANRLVGGGGVRTFPSLPLQQRGIINIGGAGQPQTGVVNVQGPVGSMTPQGFLPGCQLRGYRPNKSSYYKAVPGNPMQGVLIPKGSVCVKSRRLNVANPRALRRAIRRAQGFSKLARRVMTFVSAKAPKGRAKFRKR